MADQQESVPWTRLHETEAFHLAKNLQQSSMRRAHHNWDRILRIYGLARDSLHYPYCPALDKAILCHDVIFDSNPDREERSVKWMFDHFELSDDIQVAATLIRSTRDYQSNTDMRLVLLALSDFAWCDTRDKLIHNLGREAVAIHGLSIDDFQISFCRFICDLLRKFKQSDTSRLNDREMRLYQAICEGMSSLRNGFCASLLEVTP